LLGTIKPLAELFSFLLPSDRSPGIIRPLAEFFAFFLPSSRSSGTIKLFLKNNKITKKSKEKKRKGFHAYFYLQTYYTKLKENEFFNVLAL
jgi:hypothetical protein